MPVSRSLLQSTVLRMLADPSVDHRLGRGVHYFSEAVSRNFGPVVRDSPGGPPRGTEVTGAEVIEVCWSLLGQGLAYIDFTQPAPENWRWVLTSSGVAAAADQMANPDDPDRYMSRLMEKVPEASLVVQQFAQEAVAAYVARCYLASATMLGVASEAAFIETATAFADWLQPGKTQDNLRQTLDGRAVYVAKFDEFRKRLEAHKGELPDDLRDGLTLTMDAVLDLLRVSRNDAGHPTGRRISREDQFVHLQIFVRYLQKLYGQKTFFLAASQP